MDSASETMLVILPCPECGTDVAMEVDFRTYPAMQPSAHYPGHAAETEVWGDATCRCGHVLEVEDHRDTITATVNDHLEAFAP